VLVLRVNQSRPVIRVRVLFSFSASGRLSVKTSLTERTDIAARMTGSAYRVRKVDNRIVKSFWLCKMSQLHECIFSRLLASCRLHIEYSRQESANIGVNKRMMMTICSDQYRICYVRSRYELTGVDLLPY
jgi:hypothetical protein